MRRREKRILLAYGILLAGALAIGLVMDVMALLSWRFVPRPIAIAMIAAVTPCLYIVAQPYWTRLDDRQRESKLTSWYWGSLCGLVFGLTAAIVVSGISAGHVPSEFVRGALFVAISQVVAYYVARLIWWQANRPRGA